MTLGSTEKEQLSLQTPSPFTQCGLEFHSGSLSCCKFYGFSFMLQMFIEHTPHASIALSSRGTARKSGKVWALKECEL